MQNRAGCVFILKQIAIHCIFITSQHNNQLVSKRKMKIYIQVQKDETFTTIGAF